MAYVFPNAAKGRLAQVAEIESDLLVERIQAGLARAKRAGKELGRPKKTTDAQRAEIIAKFQPGAKISELARQYGVSRLSIARIAKPDLLRLDTSVEFEC